MKRKENITILCFLLAMFMLMSACGTKVSEKKLIGVWEVVGDPFTPEWGSSISKFELRKGNSGTMTTISKDTSPRNYGRVYTSQGPFSWRLTNKNRLEMDISPIESYVFDIEISGGGKKLILTEYGSRGVFRKL